MFIIPGRRNHFAIKPSKLTSHVRIASYIKKFFDQFLLNKTLNSVSFPITHTDELFTAHRGIFSSLIGKRYTSSRRNWIIVVLFIEGFKRKSEIAFRKKLGTQYVMGRLDIFHVLIYSLSFIV
ncbi:hypothetical protein D9M72_611310 [compost metagenome]